MPQLTDNILPNRITNDNTKQEVKLSEQIRRHALAFHFLPLHTSQAIYNVHIARYR